MNPFERSNPFQTMALSTDRRGHRPLHRRWHGDVSLFSSQTQTAQFRVDGGADRLNQNDNIYTPPELQFEPQDGLSGTTALTNGQVQNANLNASLTHTLTPKGGVIRPRRRSVCSVRLRDVSFANVVNRDLLAGPGEHQPRHDAAVAAEPPADATCSRCSGRKSCCCSGASAAHRRRSRRAEHE